MRRVILVAVLAVGTACTVGPGGSFPDSSGGGSAASTVSTTVTATGDPESTDGTSDSSGPSSGPASGDDTGTADSSADATDPSAGSSTDPTGTGDASTGSSSGGDTAAGTPLDPDLDIPDGNEQCDTPGDLQMCSGVATVCRFATAEYGLCESCDVCGNLNAACVQGTDCDILFSCFAGRCTNFCTLGTFECGPVEDCLDIGHPTRGVCDPFA